MVAQATPRTSEFSIKPPSPKRLRAVGRARGRRSWLADARAIAPVIALVVMVASVVTAGSGAVVVVQKLNHQTDFVKASFELTIKPGDNGWGTGDELVDLRHMAGDPVPVNRTQIVFDVDGTITRYGDGQLGDIATDPVYEGGESFLGTLTIPQGATVVGEVRLVGMNDDQRVGRAQAIAPTSCSAALDTTGPTGSWTTSVSPLQEGFQGASTFTITVSDGCAGVTQTTDVRLWVADAAGQFSDQGSMVRIAPSTWSLAATLDLSAHTGTLGVRATGLTDLAGNGATSDASFGLTAANPPGDDDDDTDSDDTDDSSGSDDDSDDNDGNNTDDGNNTGDSNNTDDNRGNGNGNGSNSDDNNGHGNNGDGCDEGNPGQGNGQNQDDCNPDGEDDEGQNGNGNNGNGNGQGNGNSNS